MSWMRQSMRGCPSKSSRQLLHQHRRSLHLHHYNHCHLHYKHPGRIAEHPRLGHPFRVRVREQTKSLPRSPGNTFASVTQGAKLLHCFYGSGHTPPRCRLCQSDHKLSLLTTDTMSRIVKFLQAFNSWTCQVVLGAGAMRSAGLKNVTTKHLALASQSLPMVIAIILYFRETFRHHLSPKQAVVLVEFDNLKRDYQGHQNEIHAKLIAIMGDRLAVHINSLNAIKWDAPPAIPRVSDCMEPLVKETVTPHKVLSRYLSFQKYVATLIRHSHTTHRLCGIVRDVGGLYSGQSQAFRGVHQDRAPNP